LSLSLQRGTVVGVAERRQPGSLGLSGPRELLVARSIRGAFHPDGTVDRSTLRLWGDGAGSAADPVPEVAPAAEVVAEHEQEVVWAGCVSGHFGHFLTESVARLWPLLPGGPLEGVPVVFATPGQRPFAAEWLRAFGLEVLDLPREGLARFKRMWVPEPAWRIDAWVAPEMRQIHLHAREGMELPAVSSRGPLWLSRSALERDRRVRDEALCERLLDGRIDVVHPEAMSLAQQVAQVEAAPAVTGTIGSAFHALLLARTPPPRLYLAPAKVASTFAAQEAVLGEGGSFVQVLAVERMKLRGEGRPDPYRLLIPESLRALDATVLPGLLAGDVGRFARPELPPAGVGRGPATDDLGDVVARMLLDVHSIEARMALGAAFEEAEVVDCALEQFLAVADSTEEYTYGALRAARLLSSVGEHGGAAEVARRVLALDPGSSEARRYVEAGGEG
jgi:hypothetical protein